MPRRDRKGGRLAKPTQVRILGGKAGHAPLPVGEPVPSDLAPVKPAHLLEDKVASAEWDRVLPLLAEMRILSRTDQHSIAMYCLSLSRVQKLSHYLLTHSYSVKGKGGTLKARPEVRALEVADKALRYYINLFGLAPASRAGMGGLIPPEVDKRTGMKLLPSGPDKSQDDQEQAAHRFFG